MDTLKKVWPTAFNVKKKDVASLIIQILILLVIGIIAGVLIGVLAHLPIIKWIVGIAGALIELYCIVGIVLCVLNFCDVLK